MNLKKFLYEINLGTDDASILPKVHTLVEDTNLSSLTIVSLVFSFLMLGLSVAALILKEQLGRMFPLYSVSACFCFAVYILGRFVLPQHRKLILPVFYLLLAYSFIFSILLGNYAVTKTMAVTFNVLLIAFPLFIDDVPWRMNILLFIMTAVFLMTSRLQKTAEYFHMDCVNGITFVLFAAFVNIKMQMRHINEFYTKTIIRQQRDTDMLTGTLNKKALETSIRRQISAADASGSLMMVDIDNFKHINDMYGHSVGDYFIADTAKCLISVCRSTDIIGRFGGDEFILYFPDMKSIELAEMKAKEILRTIGDYFAQSVNHEHISVSIGCTLFPRNAASYEELFKQIDTALYKAKGSGKNTYSIYQ